MTTINRTPLRPRVFLIGMPLTALAWVIIDLATSNIGWGTLWGAIAAAVLYVVITVLFVRLGWAPRPEATDVVADYAPRTIKARTRREQIHAARAAGVDVAEPTRRPKDPARPRGKGRNKGRRGRPS